MNSERREEPCNGTAVTIHHGRLARAIRCPGWVAGLLAKSEFYAVGGPPSPLTKIEPPHGSLGCSPSRADNLPIPFHARLKPGP